MRVRRLMTIGVVGLGAVVAAASIAWGCAAVTSPYLEALQPNREAVPAMVVVKGGNWVAHEKLDLLWSPTGENLGSVKPSGDGSFSTKVEIPASAERGEDYVDYVRAVQATKSAATPFGVDSTAEEGAPEVQEPERVTSMSTSGGGTRSPSGTTEQGQQPSGQPQTGGSGGIPARPADRTAEVASTGPASGTDAAGAVSSAPAATPAGAPATGPRIREGAMAPATAGSPASPLAVPAPAKTESTSATAQPQVAARGSLGDLWTGVAGGPAAPGHSLLNLPADTQSTSPAAAVGVVLAISLVALFAGFGVAEVRRHRMMAEVEG